MIKATLKPGTSMVVYHWVAGGTIEPTVIDADDDLSVEIDENGTLTVREFSETLPMVAFATGGWIRYELISTAEFEAQFDDLLDELDEDCCED